MRKLVPFIAISFHGHHAHPFGQLDRVSEHKRFGARLAQGSSQRAR